MQCTECGLWELVEGDLVCSWCRESYLRYTVTLAPAALSTEDYPPPVELHIRNESPLGTITLDRIETSQSWITLLPDQPLSHGIAPGAGQTLLLDVDTFAAPSELQATITVTVKFATAPGRVILYLQQPDPASGILEKS